jgi:hypothetical protein
VQKIQYGMQSAQAKTQATISNIQGVMQAGNYELQSSLALLNGDTTAKLASNDAMARAESGQVAAAGTIRAANINANYISNSAYISGETQAKAAIMNAGYNADILRINAGQSENVAQSVLYGGQRQSEMVTLRGGQLKSSQRTGLAANGVDLGSTTAQNVLNTTDIMMEIDANAVAANAIRSAWGYRTQAVNELNQANLAIANGDAAAIAARFQALAAGESAELQAETIGIQAQSQANINSINTLAKGAIISINSKSQAQITSINALTNAQNAQIMGAANAAGLDASATSYAAQSAAISPSLAFGSTLITGATNVASTVYKMSTVGLFDKD